MVVNIDSEDYFIHGYLGSSFLQLLNLVLESYIQLDIELALNLLKLVVKVE